MKTTTLSTAVILSTLALASVGVQAADVSEAAYQPIPGDEKQSLDHLLQQGLAAAGHQDWPATIRYYLAAHHVAPQNPEPLFNLGLAASQLPGRELKAIAWFEAFLEAAPLDPRAAEVRRQIGRLRDGARAHALRLFAVTEKAVTPLPPDNRIQPAIALATTAARLNDGDLVIRWLADWGDDLYHKYPFTSADDLCTAQLGVESDWSQWFSKAIAAASPATAARTSARSWEADYLTTALNSKGVDSVGGHCTPKPDAKPKLADHDVPFALGEIAKADVELGRTPEAETLLPKLQALSNAQKTDRAALISLVGAKIAMGKRAEAETDLRTWYALAQTGDFFTLRDHDGNVAVADWSALGNVAEARRVIDLYQSAALKSVADSVSRHTQNPLSDEQLRYDTVLSEFFEEEDSVYLAVMRLAIAAGDFVRAADALDHAWQADRKGQAAVTRFATTHPRNLGSGYERELTHHFYDATLELAQALHHSGNQAALESLIEGTLARARIEQQDDAHLPALPTQKTYTGSMLFPDRGVGRAYDLENKLSHMMKLVALSRDPALLPQYAQFIRSSLPRGDNAATLIELAELELRKSGPAAAQPDLLAAVSDIDHCSDKLYACDGIEGLNSWSSGPGLLLLLPKGEALLDDHLRNFQRSFVWHNIKSPPTAQQYTHSLRARAARATMEISFDAPANATPSQRAQAWADYAEWALPGYAALDDRNLIGESVSITEHALGNASFSWSAINDQVNQILDQLDYVARQDPSRPGT